MKLGIQLCVLIWLIHPFKVATSADSLSIRIKAGSGEISVDGRVLIEIENTTQNPIMIWDPRSRQGLESLSFTFSEPDLATVVKAAHVGREYAETRAANLYSTDATIEVYPHDVLRWNVFPREFRRDGIPEPNSGKLYE